MTGVLSSVLTRRSSAKTPCVLCGFGFVLNLTAEDQTEDFAEDAEKIRVYEDRSFLFQHRKNVSGRILKPGDRRAAVAVNSLLVRFDFTFVLFKANAFPIQFIDGLVDVVDEKIENGEAGRRVIRFRIDEDVGVTRMNF